MPRKFIDKKKATTFHLVHRSQRDPLINDPESSARVLKYVPPSNAKAAQGITRESLEEDIDVEAVRANEGEAAEHGIFYDDTEYDYMQHLRSVGEAPDAILLEAPSKAKEKGKGKEIVFGEKLGLPKDILPSEEEEKYRLESMQNIPDSLRGFQPDMDPDLREVLVALEEEEEEVPEEETTEESDGEDPEDMFAQLVKGGALEEEEPVDLDEEDYDSDDTIKAVNRDITGSRYLAEMAQYKVSKAPQDDTDSLVGGLEIESMTSTASKAHTHLTSKQRRRRRDKLGGAYSEAGTDFSMTSSANFRNSGLTTLDDRFDKILEEYNSGDEEESVVSTAPAPKPFKENRADFNSIMDEFLTGYKVLGKHMVKKTGGKSGGMAELDQIRRDLGKARIS